MGMAITVAANPRSEANHQREGGLLRQIAIPIAIEPNQCRQNRPPNKAQCIIDLITDRNPVRAMKPRLPKQGDGAEQFILRPKIQRARQAMAAQGQDPGDLKLAVDHRSAAHLCGVGGQDGR